MIDTIRNAIWSDQGLSSIAASIEIEEDIREALQAVGSALPSFAQRERLMAASERVGISYYLMGFPAASTREADTCVQLAAAAEAGSFSLKLVAMCRANEDDVTTAARVAHESGRMIFSDIFCGVSPARMAVEGWSIADVSAQFRGAISRALDCGLGVRISLEDASRAQPSDIELVIDMLSKYPIDTVTICDTAGALLPEEAHDLTRWLAVRINNQTTKIGWHGHNDKGLALANALASARGGANVLSGSFLGIGERAGNVALEQILYLLWEAGSRRHDLRFMGELCKLFCESAGYALPPTQPIVGSRAFDTSAGTHAAAIVKAKLINAEPDAMFTGVNLQAVGQVQTIRLGRNSGHAAIRDFLIRQYGSAPECAIEALLDACKSCDSAELSETVCFQLCSDHGLLHD